MFGSDCYAYRQQQQLQPQCERGIFFGHCTNSPAYLIFNPVTEKVTKHLMIKFIHRNSIEQQTQTVGSDLEAGAPRYTNEHRCVTESGKPWR